MDSIDNAGIPTNEEIERALRRAWFPLARVADLREPRRVKLLGETLAVYLGADGAPHVVADRCMHRGASLSDGQVDGDRIVCPYHGWQWRGADGRCMHIPSLGQGADIPPRAQVAAYQAQERWGLVWCSLDASPISLPAPDWLDAVAWGHAAGRPMSVSAGIRASTENFRDVAHFPFVHQSTMGHLPTVVEPLEVQRRGTEVLLTRRYSASGGDGAMWRERMTFSYHAIAPSYVFLRMEDDSGAARILINAPSPHTAPTDPGRPETTIFWVEGVTPDYTEMTLDEVLEAEARVYEEDNPILDRIEPGEAPLDAAGQVHTPADRYTLEYRRAFIAFVDLANRGRGAETEAASLAM